MAVLIVDDATIMRIVIKDILVRHCGYKKADIIEAVGGRDALYKYKKGHIEFVICDISMPDMNGADVVAALVETDPDVKVIMCSAAGDEENIKKCIIAGAKDYIVKPPKPERVMIAVEKLTGKVLIVREEDDEAYEEEHDDAPQDPPEEQKRDDKSGSETEAAEKEVKEGEATESGAKES